MEDMFKILEQAQQLSKLFFINGEQPHENGKEENENTNAPNGIDIENLMKTMEMINTLNQLMPNQSEQQAFSEEDPVTDFDKSFKSPPLDTMKASIPYLEYEYQKPLAIIVKCMEIKQIMEKYSVNAAQIQQHSGSKEEYRQHMLLAIRPHMDEEKKSMIDMLIKLMDIKAISNKLNILRSEDNGAKL